MDNLAANLYELVYVENTGDDELSFPVSTDRRQVIPPGDRALIKFELAASAFGHPSARNSAKEPARAEMHKDLKTYWGFYHGFDTERADQQMHRDVGWSSWEEKAPKFRVTTLNGDWIPMILDDPDGVEPLPSEDGAADPATARASGNAAVLDRTLAALEQRSRDQEDLINRLLARLDEKDAAELVPPPAADVEGNATPGAPPTPVPTAATSELPKADPNEPPPTADAPRGAKVRNPRG